MTQQTVDRDMRIALQQLEAEVAETIDAVAEGLRSEFAERLAEAVAQLRAEFTDKLQEAIAFAEAEMQGARNEDATTATIRTDPDPDETARHAAPTDRRRGVGGPVA